jgi:hypothetical protein
MPDQNGQPMMSDIQVQGTQRHMQSHFEMTEQSRPLLEVVQRVIVEQDDYSGFGMHNPQNHHGGEHTQVSLGLKNGTVNFRDFTVQE